MCPNLDSVSLENIHGIILRLQSFRNTIHKDSASKLKNNIDQEVALSLKNNGTCTSKKIRKSKNKRLSKSRPISIFGCSASNNVGRISGELLDSSNTTSTVINELTLSTYSCGLHHYATSNNALQQHLQRMQAFKFDTSNLNNTSSAKRETQHTNYNNIFQSFIPIEENLQNNSNCNANNNVSFEKYLEQQNYLYNPIITRMNQVFSSHDSNSNDSDISSFYNGLQIQQSPNIIDINNYSKITSDHSSFKPIGSELFSPFASHTTNCSSKSNDILNATTFGAEEKQFDDTISTTNSTSSNYQNNNDNESDHLSTDIDSQSELHILFTDMKTLVPSDSAISFDGYTTDTSNSTCTIDYKSSSAATTSFCNLLAKSSKIRGSISMNNCPTDDIFLTTSHNRNRIKQDTCYDYPWSTTSSCTDHEIPSLEADNAVCQYIASMNELIIPDEVYNKCSNSNDYMEDLGYSTISTSSELKYISSSNDSNRKRTRIHNISCYIGRIENDDHNNSEIEMVDFLSNELDEDFSFLIE